MSGNSILAFGNFELNVTEGTLVENGREITLQRRVVQLLSFLAAGTGRIISKEELIEEIWQGEPIGDNNVEQHISIARRALKDTIKPHRYIVTVHRRGYRFVAPVTIVTPQPVFTAASIPSLSQTLADELYGSGRHFASLLHEGALRSATDLYRKALQLSPHSAYIHAALGYAEFLLGHSCFDPPSIAFERARAAAHAALALNPDCAEAYFVLAALRFYCNLDLRGALEYVDRVKALAPAFEPAHMLHVRVRIVEGDLDAALGAASQGMALCQQSLPMAACAGMALYFAGRYDVAVERLRRICALEPGYQLSRYFLGACYLFLNKPDIARKHFCAVLSNNAVNLVARSTSHRHHAAAALMYLEARTGNTEAAIQLFEQYRSASRARYTSPMVLAVAYAGLNRRRETESKLLESRTACDPWLAFANVEPYFKHFCADTRFAALLDSVLRARAA